MRRCIACPRESIRYFVANRTYVVISRLLSGCSSCLPQSFDQLDLSGVIDSVTGDSKDEIDRLHLGIRRTSAA
jgi:hypothetical protein